MCFVSWTPPKQLTSRSSNLILSASQEGEVKRADDSPPNHRPLLQELVNGIAELDPPPKKLWWNQDQVKIFLQKLINGAGEELVLL